MEKAFSCVCLREQSRFLGILVQSVSGSDVLWAESHSMSTTVVAGPKGRLRQRKRHIWPWGLKASPTLASQASFGRVPRLHV